MAKSITIGQVCKVITGKLDANAANENGKYPFFTCSVAPLRINNYAYDLECVLIAGNGDLNVKYYKGKFNAYQRTYIISLKDGVSNVSVRYLYAFFLSYIDVLRKRSIGSTIKYIRLGDITEATILIPSLPEQLRIVDILDQEFAKIDALKANAEKSLQAAKDLFREALNHYFSGKNALLGDVLNLRRGHDLTHSEMEDGSIPVAGSGGIIGYHSIATPISPCIAVGRSGSVGKVFVYETCWAHNTILYVDDFKGNNPYYLVYLLKSMNLTSYGGGSAVPTLNRNILHPLSVGYTPNKKEQATIVACLDDLNDKCKALQDNYQKTISLCDDLKQSLLRKAFNGEL